MFGSRKIRQECQLEVDRIRAEHKLELKAKEFEITHFKDNEIQKMRQHIVEVDQKVAVLEKENEMLVKITDLNGDIIDVKDLVNKLIGKLPEIKLDSLAILPPRSK